MFMPLPIFNPFWSFTNNFQDYFLIALLAVLVILTVLLRRGSRVRNGYSPRLAWMRGGIYFASCFALSILSGVFPTLIDSPLIMKGQASSVAWWALTLSCTGVIYFAYFYLWPKGTVTHGRTLHLPSALTFGLLWGLSEGQLFLSVWALIEKLFSTPWLVPLLSFGVIGTFKGIWQSQYWDIHVAPEHNLPEWNARKVLLGHVPNLLLTLSYLALFGNALLFLLFQTAGLTFSAYKMHFPAWSDDPA